MHALPENGSAGYAHLGRAVAEILLARSMLDGSGMKADEAWTIPLHIIMWTTIAAGLIMAMVVVMMH